MPRVAVQLSAAADAALSTHMGELLVGVGQARFDALTSEEKKKRDSDDDREEYSRHGADRGFALRPTVVGDTTQTVKQAGGQEQKSNGRAGT